MTVTTIEPTVLEDLDFKPCCETENCAFGHPPATHFSATPCGCSQLICTGSAGIQRNKIRDAIHYGKLMSCGYCWTAVDPAKVRIEPLP
jgi:hypothetical protein